MRTRAVIRVGRPKLKSPRLNTDRPLIWPTFSPVGIDHQGAAPDLLLDTLAHPVGASGLRIDSGLHVDPFDQLGLTLPRPVVALAQQIGEAAHVRRQPVAVLQDAGAVFDQATDGLPVEFQQLVLAHQGGDQAGVEGLVVARAIHIPGEIHLHLEQLAELRIVARQQVVDKGFAEQNDLDVQRHRLGFERYRADQTHLLRQGLDTNLAGLEGTFQRLPGERLTEHLDGIQDQIPSIGPVQCTGADHGEVGHERALLGHVFDPADEIGIGRVVLVDHRCAAVGLVHQEGVHPIAVEPRHALVVFQHAESEQRDPRLILGQKAPVVVDDVGLQGIEMAEHVRQSRVFLAQCVDQVGNGARRHVPVQLLDLLVTFLLQLRHLVQGALEVFLQALDVRLDPLSFGLRKLLEVLRCDRLALAHRTDGEPGRGLEQRQGLPLGPLLDHADRLFLPLVGLRLDRLGASAVFVALERRHHRRTQILDQLFQVGGKSEPGSRRQAQGSWTVPGLEIVDIAPVVGALLAGGLLLRIVANQGLFARPGWAQGEQVVALAADPDAETHRLQGPWLTDELGEFSQFRRSGELQRGEIAGPIEFLRRKPSTCHRIHLFLRPQCPLGLFDYVSLLPAST